MQNKNILFFTSSIVEVDNFLPILKEFKTSNCFCDIAVLDYCRIKIHTPFFLDIINYSNIYSIYNFVSKKLIRNIMLLLSFTLEFASKHPNNLILIYLSKCLRASLRLLVNKSSAGICNFYLSKYDYLFISPSLAEQIMRGTNASYGLLIDWHTLPHHKVIFFPETFDQFSNIPEYHNISYIEKFSNSYALLSRTISPINENISDINIKQIGSPRYSKYWCETLSNFYTKHIPKRDDLYLTILYLPIKASPPKDWLIEEVKRQDRELFALLDRYNDIRVIVKPHPRTIGAYNDLSEYTKHVDRVEVYEIMVDTAELVEKSDVCITGGTSFIPHLLWRNIPVVLTDDWAKKMGNEFLMKHCCFSWEDIDELLSNIRQSIPIKQPCSEQALVNMFQCGVASEEYQGFLNSKLKTLQKR